MTWAGTTLKLIHLNTYCQQSLFTKAIYTPSRNVQGSRWRLSCIFFYHAVAECYEFSHLHLAFLVYSLRKKKFGCQAVVERRNWYYIMVWFNKTGRCHSVLLFQIGLLSLCSLGCFKRGVKINQK